MKKTILRLSLFTLNAFTLLPCFGMDVVDTAIPVDEVSSNQFIVYSLSSDQIAACIDNKVHISLGSIIKVLQPATLNDSIMQIMQKTLIPNFEHDLSQNIPEAILGLGFPSVSKHCLNEQQQQQCRTKFKTIHCYDPESESEGNTISEALISLKDYDQATSSMIACATSKVTTWFLLKALKSKFSDDIHHLPQFSIIFIHDTVNEQILITGKISGNLRKNLVGGLELILDLVEAIDAVVYPAPTVNPTNPDGTIAPATQIATWRKITHIVLSGVTGALCGAIWGLQLYQTFWAPSNCGNFTAVNTTM